METKNLFGGAIMELEHIREFLVLSELCNYNEAAERLYLSQSALFKHIKAMETEIGAPLFNRIGRRIVISNIGQLFIPYATETIKSYDLFMKRAEAKRTETSNLILIGTQYRVTDLVSDFRRKNDTYLLRTIEGGEVDELLYDLNCDLAFVCNLEDPDHKYTAIHYTTDQLAAILYPSHPLASRESIRLEELAHENFVAISAEKKAEDPALNLCVKSGFDPRIVLTARPGNEVARLVAQGIGIALLNKNVTLKTSQDNIVVVDVEPAVKYDVSLVYRNDIILAPGAKAFVDFIKELNKEKETTNYEENDHSRR